MISRKDKYREYSEKNESIPIFSKGWWLDSVCGEKNWDVNLIQNNKEIIASMPYFIYSTFPFRIIKMPPLSQNLGINIFYPQNQKLVSKYSYERKIIQEFIEKIPKFDWFQQSFNHSFSNWLPFYWKNFKQTTAYTYILNTNDGIDKIYNSLKSNIRWDIRKAEKTLKIFESENIDLLYQLNASSYENQSNKIKYNLGTLKKIYESCSKRNCCKLYIASDDKTGKVYTAHLYVWDSKSVYYLVGGSDINFRNSGAASLLMWHGIKLAHEMKLKFDFEGSMNKSIERFFSSFGAYQVPYMKIEKINSKPIKIKRFLFNNKR